MKCRDCGTNIDLEVHQDFICYDCWSRADLAQYELEQKKKNNRGRRVGLYPIPPPTLLSHLHIRESADIVGRLIVGVFDGI